MLVGIGGHGVYRGLNRGERGQLLDRGFIFLTQGKDTHTAHGHKPEPGSYRELLRDRPFVGFMAASTIYSLCCMVITIALPIYVRGSAASLRLGGRRTLRDEHRRAGAGSPIAIRWLVRFRRTRALMLASLVWVFSADCWRWRWRRQIGGDGLHLRGGADLIDGGMVVAPIATALCSEAGPERNARPLHGHLFAWLGPGGFVRAELLTGLFALRAGAPWMAVALLSVIAAGSCWRGAALACRRRSPDRERGCGRHRG